MIDQTMKKKEKEFMAMPFEPEEIDDLDETLLEVMDGEELEDFREKLQATLDEMYVLEPDIDEDEDEYYQWQDRINVLQDMLDAAGDQQGDVP